MHPFRLPSPSLWRDVLQKMRAFGYNAVSIYVSWNYHSPAQGSYDFTGVRDLDLFLRMAAETGLYVILRPGPYINAEIDAGGFPGWLVATKGTARTSDPTYLSHVDEWLTQVDSIVSKHLFTQGTGTVLLYQIENEYDAHVTEPSGRDYMSHLYKRVRADGIDVPLFHNDKGRNGYWTPGSFDTGADTGGWLYGFDGYPTPSQPPPDWGHFGIGGAKGGATASPKTPGFVPEFGGGWFDPWGGSWFDGKGYAESRRTRDAAYERRFYLTNLANGLTLHNVYMTFGGTSWGWLPAPVVYTSYDYGAAFDEGRNPTAKLVPMHQLGQLLRTVPDFAKLDRAADVKADGLKVYHLTNADTGAHVYVLRNDSAKAVTSTLPTATDDVEVTVPAQDARLLVTQLALGGRKLRYSTVTPMMSLTTGRQDIAVFAGTRGEMAHAVVECPEEPVVTRLDAQAAWVWDRGLLHVTVPLGIGGLTRVLVQGGGVDNPSSWSSPTRPRPYACGRTRPGRAPRSSTAPRCSAGPPSAGRPPTSPATRSARPASRCGGRAVSPRSPGTGGRCPRPSPPRAACARTRTPCCPACPPCRSPRSTAGAGRWRTRRPPSPSTTPSGRRRTALRRSARPRSPPGSPCSSRTTTASTTATSGTAAGSRPARPTTSNR